MKKTLTGVCTLFLSAILILSLCGCDIGSNLSDDNSGFNENSYGVREFQDFMQTLADAPSTCSYKPRGINKLIVNNGNQGVIASKIWDFDSDEQAELMVIMLNWHEDFKANCIDLIFYECYEGIVTEQARINMSNVASCLNGNFKDYAKIVFKDNHIGLFYRFNPLQTTPVIYRICSYDGSSINTDVLLSNPGYTFGIGLFDITASHENSLTLYTDTPGAQKGLYDSYNEAVNDKMKPCGIQSVLNNIYEPDITLNKGTELLCELKTEFSYEADLVTGYVTTYSDARQ